VHRKTKDHYRFYKKIVYMKDRFLRKDLDSTEDERLIESYRHLSYSFASFFNKHRRSESRVELDAFCSKNYILYFFCLRKKYETCRKYRYTLYASTICLHKVLVYHRYRDRGRIFALFE